MSLKRLAKAGATGALRALEGVARGGADWPVEVKSVLVLEYLLPLGCCVHQTPVYEAMKAGRPGMTVAVATRGLGAEVVRHSPFVDHVMETADPLTDLRGAVRGLRRELKARGLRPDCVLTGASDRRTRIALLGMLACAGRRGGFTEARGLYQRALEYDRGRSLIDNNLRLAGLVGVDERHREPRVFFSRAELEAARGRVREANPAGAPLVVFVTQNSGGQRTGWHLERFVEAIRRAAAMGCAVAYAGTAGDARAVEEIRAAAGVGASLAGRTSVTELAAVLALSDWMVSLDTGTMHVGRAVGAPMVVIGPSWQRPVEWLPLGVENVRILRGEDREDVPPGYRLDEVGAGDVIAALEELVRAYPASEAAREERVRRSLAG